MTATAAIMNRHVAECLRDVPIAMRDGVVLRADVHAADLRLRRPVVLERTPYGKERCDQAERTPAGLPSREELAAHYLDAGFIYVVEDCRGTGRSDGDFVKYTQEAEDGVDTIAALLDMAWCDGRVMLVGHSYCAMVQIAAASLGGVPIAAMIPDCGGFSDAFRSGIRQGGAFDQKQATWAFTQAVRAREASGDMAGAAAMRQVPLLDLLKAGPWAPGRSPLAGAPEHERNLAAFWQQGTDGAFWKRPGLHVDPDNTRMDGIPSLFVTSWHDTSLVSVLDNFGARAARGDETARLVVGPWCHAEKYSSVAGEVDFGDEALPDTGLGGPMRDIRTRFLADVLAGDTTGMPTVRYFEMGGGDGHRTRCDAFDYGGRWRAAASWPPADARPLTFWLLGGQLGAQPPSAAWSDTFHSDPEQPVPTRGGAINSGGALMPGGMFDQAALFPTESRDGVLRSLRDDVLTFATPPLAEDLHLCGSVALDLHVACDAPDADVTVKLMDCFPDGGPVLNLSDGILRLRYRDSFTAPTLLEAGRIYRIRIEALPVACLVRAGHRLRLDIAGSNFPHFDINPHTGGPEGVPRPRRPAVLTVVSDPQQPSKLELTVRSAG